MWKKWREREVAGEGGAEAGEARLRKRGRLRMSDGEKGKEGNGAALWSERNALGHGELGPAAADDWACTSHTRIAHVL